MFIGAHKILSLFANNGWDLIDIINFSVWAFGLSTKSLLTKANDFCFFINGILIDRSPSILCRIPISIKFFSILCEKVFTCNFFDCRIEINNVLFHFISLVILIRNTTLRINHSRMHTMILIKKLIALIQGHWPNFR